MNKKILSISLALTMLASSAAYAAPLKEFVNNSSEVTTTFIENGMFDYAKFRQYAGNQLTSKVTDTNAVNADLKTMVSISGWNGYQAYTEQNPLHSITGNFDYKVTLNMDNIKTAYDELLNITKIAVGGEESAEYAQLMDSIVTGEFKVVLTVADDITFTAPDLDTNATFTQGADLFEFVGYDEATKTATLKIADGKKVSDLAANNALNDVSFVLKGVSTTTKNVKLGVTAKLDESSSTVFKEAGENTEYAKINYGSDESSTYIYFTTATGGGSSSGGSSSKPSTDPSTPSTPSTDPSTPSAPVTDVKADVSGTTATVTDVDSDSLTNKDSLSVGVSGSDTTVDTVVIPKDSVSEITSEDTTIKNVEITLDSGSVKLDKETFDAISKDTETEETKDITVSISNATENLTEAETDAVKNIKDPTVIDVSVSAGDKKVTDFNGGSATVTISYEIGEGKLPETVEVHQITEDGQIIPVQSSYDSETGKVSIEASSSAKYAVSATDAKDAIVLTIGEKEAQVFGESKSNDVAPQIVSDRTMLPIRFVAEELGATVSWAADTKTVTVAHGDKTIALTIGENTATVNGEIITLDSASFIDSDRTFLPVRFVAEHLGAKVFWSAKNQKVIIAK